MIERREGTGTLVLEKSGVPIYDVADAIIEYYNIESVCEKFPISKEEVFEVVDAMTGILDGWEDGDIKLTNNGDVTNINLQTEIVSDTLFFHLLSYGRTENTESDDFDELYRTGLGKIVGEIFSGMVHEDFDVTDSPMHRAIYNALVVTIGDNIKEIIIEANNKGTPTNED